MMTDYRQSEEYNRYFAQNGWLVEKSGSTVILIRKIPLLGSVIKIKRCPPDLSLAKLEAVAQTHRALVIKIEVDIKTSDPGCGPLEKEFQRNGYRDSRFVFCPSKTAYIDLTKDENDLYAGFEKDIRKDIERNRKDGVEVKIAKTFEEIYPLLKEAGEKRHFVVQNYNDWKNQWGAFGDKAKVVLAYKNGGSIGGNMFLVTPPLAFGLFLPISQIGRSLKVAGTLLWEGFKLAKQAGGRSFDLEGVYDDRYGSPKEWLGLTTFKRKFRGREAEFIRAQIKVRSWYLKPFGWLGLL